MIEVTRILLENDMDVVVAQKRMMRLAEYFKLTLSTQTTIATAVAEVSRVVVDRTDQGLAQLGFEKQDDKFYLTASISFDETAEIRESDEGLRYAKLLVPEFSFHREPRATQIKLKIGIPRSRRLTEKEIRNAKDFFGTIKPSSPYELIKLKNSALNEQALRIGEELLHTRELDEKKNEFIAIASHELKTPITSLKAFTELALQVSKDDGETKLNSYLVKINKQVHKLTLLIQHLLDVSKIESGKVDYRFQKVRWNDFMDEIIPLLRMMVPSHNVTWESNDFDAEMEIDPFRVEQVFTNLLNNAAKYSAAQTTIAVSSSYNDGMIQICIRDQGIGIAPANLTRIFEKYFREEETEKKYSGFGMGLFISSSIVQQHQGKIWATSASNQGASFYFTLPTISILVPEPTV